MRSGLERAKILATSLRGEFTHRSRRGSPGMCRRRRSYRLIAAELALTPEDDLLDVACGWGEFLLMYAQQAHRVCGIDVSEEKVALARQRLAVRIAAHSAEIVQGDAAVLPWGGETTFSAATCMDAFPFFPEPEAVMSEVFRVLPPGGRMLTQVGMRWPDGQPKSMINPFSPWLVMRPPWSAWSKTSGSTRSRSRPGKWAVTIAWGMLSAAG